MKTHKIKTHTFLAVLLSSFLYGQAALAMTEKAPSAASVIAAAETKAASENKNVFVMFHASWCGWCHRLDGFLAKPEIAPLINANYVTVHIDVGEPEGKKDLENSGGDELYDRLGGKGMGIPYCAVLSPTNETLAVSKDSKGVNMAYPSGDDQILAFVKMLRTTSHNFSDSDADLVSKKMTEANAKMDAEQEARDKLLKPINDAIAAHDYKAAVAVSGSALASRPDMATFVGLPRYQALLHVDEDKALLEFGQPMGGRAPKDADGIRAMLILNEDSLSDRAYNKALQMILESAGKSKVHWMSDRLVARAYARVHDIKKATEYEDKAIAEAKEAKAPQKAIDNLIKREKEWQEKGG